MRITITFLIPNMNLGRIIAWLHTSLSLSPYPCLIQTEEIGKTDEQHVH